MDQSYFEFHYPQEKIDINVFVHEIMNYRYHWHANDYELNILLNGSQEFCIGTTTYLLTENDVLLVNPGIGHCSLAQNANTRALVLHFSDSILKPYLPKGQIFNFTNCISSESTQMKEEFCKLRYYASQIYQVLSSEDTFSLPTAKASLELLIISLVKCFESQISKKGGDDNALHLDIINNLTTYIENHYSERITLEELSKYARYNRTYISTLFKDTAGVNFYEYLSRVRFQKALHELSTTSKNLTDIAMDNGFSDLKAFSNRFKETLHRSPMEYRSQLSPNRLIDEGNRIYINPHDDILQNKIQEYLSIFSRYANH